MGRSWYWVGPGRTYASGEVKRWGSPTIRDPAVGRWDTSSRAWASGIIVSVGFGRVHRSGEDRALASPHRVPDAGCSCSRTHAPRARGGAARFPQRALTAAFDRAPRWRTRLQ